MTIDRREEIQKILDKSWPGCVAVKPDKGDLAERCVVRNSRGEKVPIDLPRTWFDDGEWDRIEAAIRRGIETSRN